MAVRQHVEPVVARAPGVAAAVLLALAAWAVSRGSAALFGVVVSATPSALVGGLALGAALEKYSGIRARLTSGLHLTSSTVLRTAIVLLGLRFGFMEVLATGRTAVVAAVAVILTASAIVAALAHVSGLSPRLATLLGVGTAICGNSAIAAVAPVIDADDSEVAASCVVITVMGTIAMITYPLVGFALELGDATLGVVAGAGIHDSAQAIAGGFAYSDEAGGIATVVKLTRVAFLLPAVIVIGGVTRRRGVQAGTARTPLPLFVLGFALASVVRTVGDVLWATQPAWERLLTTSATVATVLLLVAMAGVGLGADLSRVRQLGLKPVMVGALAALATSAVALLMGLALTS